MSNIEEFEKWLSKTHAFIRESSDSGDAAWHGFMARQPEIDALKAQVERLTEALAGLDFAAAPTPPAQERIELPKLVAYKSTSIPEEQWRNEPIDYWLRGMLRHCDYHDGLVIKATLAFLEGLNNHPADDKLREAAGEAEKLISYWRGYAPPILQPDELQVIDNLRAALEGNKGNGQTLD